MQYKGARMRMNYVFEGLKEKKGRLVGVLGDLILDTSIQADLKRKTPFILTQKVRTDSLGGAGNVAANLKRLGVNPILFSVLGQDKSSKKIHKILKQEKYNRSGLLFEKDRKVSNKISLITDNKVILRLDRDEKKKISPEMERKLIAKFEKKISKLEILVLSNYSKGCITGRLFDAIKKRCLARKVKLIVDSHTMLDFSGVYLLKVNRSEFESMIGKNLSSRSEYLQYGWKFKRANKIRNLLITLDKDGLILINSQNRCLLLKSHCDRALDACGAGDSMIAAVAASLMCKMRLEQAVNLGNYAAAICCQKVGAYAVGDSEIRPFIALGGRMEGGGEKS